MNACALVIDSSLCVQAKKLYENQTFFYEKRHFLMCIHIKESQDYEEEEDREF